MQSLKRLSKKSVWAALLLACAAVLTTGGVLARYVSSNRQRTEMESAQFHISSDYLEEKNGAAYTVADWGSGFDILLYNYEKENIAQISAVDMSYTVTANKAEVSVRTQSGAAVATDAQGAYPFGKSDTRVYHRLHVTPSKDLKQGDTVTVTVTTAPFKKKLEARFTIQGKLLPDYTAADQYDGTVLVTIKTNDYEGSMTVTWDSGKFSPDNTNALMQTWTDASATGSFSAESNHTYELLFFKKTAEVSGEKTGSGTVITLN